MPSPRHHGRGRGKPDHPPRGSAVHLREKGRRHLGTARGGSHPSLRPSLRYCPAGPQPSARSPPPTRRPAETPPRATSPAPRLGPSPRSSPPGAPAVTHPAPRRRRATRRARRLTLFFAPPHPLPPLALLAGSPGGPPLCPRQWGRDHRPPPRVPLTVSWTPAQDAIVWQLRLPRVLAAALVGAALAASGASSRASSATPWPTPTSSASPPARARRHHRPGPPRAEPAPRRRSDRPLGRRDRGGTGAPVRLPRRPLAATLVTTLARRGNRLPITDLLLAGFATARYSAPPPPFSW